MMVTELDRAGIFALMERERLDYIADEIRLGQSGLMDPETAPEMGKIKGAQYSMTGAITLYYYSEKAGGIILPVIGGASEAKTAYVSLDIRIIDNATGEIVYTAEQQGKAKREMKGFGAAYKGFYAGSFKRTYGGILGTATRDAVLKHVAAMKARSWEEI
ncbi:MAG: penicillin-binding protein activator LpoB, partial [Fretibacterium sp.]|nr:penicillin-binding protein activator LpoB [Fretibacterium sp.]